MKEIRLSLEKLNVKVNVTGTPSLPDESLLCFFNRVYGFWGTQEQLKWKYRVKKNVEITSVEVKKEDELVAFRGVFGRKLIFGEKTIKSSVFGDASVLPDHRGEGLYRILVNEGFKFSENRGYQLLMTFTQVGSLTNLFYKKNKWQAIGFPVRLKIISYSRVFYGYFDKALKNNPQLAKILHLYGSNIQLSINNETFSLGSENSRVALVVYLNEEVFAILINNRHLSLSRLLWLLFIMFLRRKIKLKIYSHSLLWKMGRELVAVLWKK